MSYLELRSIKFVNNCFKMEIINYGTIKSFYELNFIWHCRTWQLLIAYVNSLNNIMLVFSKEKCFICLWGQLYFRDFISQPAFFLPSFRSLYSSTPGQRPLQIFVHLTLSCTWFSVRFFLHFAFANYFRLSVCILSCYVFHPAPLLLTISFRTLCLREIPSIALYPLWYSDTVWVFLFPVRTLQPALCRYRWLCVLDLYVWFSVLAYMQVCQSPSSYFRALVFFP